MDAGQILTQLSERTALEGPHWTEPVRILTVKARGNRIEVQAVGTHTKRLWTKLLKPEEFDGTIKVTQAGDLAALNGDPTHFRLAAEAHRIRLAFQYDPHFAVSVSQVDPLPHQMDAVYTHLLTQPRIRFLIADDPGAGKTIMGGLGTKELKFRGLIRRTLIITPANLTDQWRRELHDKFGETFTGGVDRSGENVQALAVAKRMKMKNLGEPASDGTRQQPDPLARRPGHQRNPPGRRQGKGPPQPTRGPGGSSTTERTVLNRTMKHTKHT